MHKALLILVFFACTTGSIAQNVVVGTGSPAPSAQLEVSSTTKGFLPPRMTTIERNAIASPATGLIIYNTTTNNLEIRNSSGWSSLTAPAAAVFLPSFVIGSQQWMSKNLDVAFYRNGDPIPQVTDPAEWAALTTGAWCYYNNDPILGYKYGKLYNWYAVNDPRGLAPQGWHIPSQAEWTALQNTLGGTSVAGGRLKEPGTANWSSPNTGAANSIGWEGLPGAYRLANGTSLNVGLFGFWWSSTQSSASNAWAGFLLHDSEILNTGGSNKKSGYSVRCIMD